MLGTHPACVIAAFRSRVPHVPPSRVPFTASARWPAANDSCLLISGDQIDKEPCASRLPEVCPLCPRQAGRRPESERTADEMRPTRSTDLFRDQRCFRLPRTAINASPVSSIITEAGSGTAAVSSRSLSEV